MRRVAFGLGSAAKGSPFERGRLAARAAREQAGALPPALAILAAGDRAQAAEILRGAREALPGCPLVGLVSDAERTLGAPRPLDGVQILLLASAHLTAKVGVGAAAGSIDEEVATAFRNSRIGDPGPGRSPETPEQRLFRWYSYRRPSFALALVASEPQRRRERAERAAALLRRRFQGGVPFLVHAHAPEGESPAVLADESVVSGGVVLVTVKTDLQFSFERFHNYEPFGERLFVTRAAGRRVLEFNGRPARDAYRQAVGAPAREGEDAADKVLFSLFPLAVRERDGRHGLILPEGADGEGALLFPASMEEVPVLFPMRAVSSFEVGRPARRAADPGATDYQGAAGAVFLRNAALRDHAPVPFDVREQHGAPLVLEVPVDVELQAHLGRGEGEGGAGHLLFVLRNQLEPLAVAARENERLLREVVHFKQLNQTIFDGIGYGIALVGGGRRILHSNESYRALMACPEGEEPRLCPLAAAEAPCPSCAAESALANGTFATQEVVRRTAAGKSWLRIDAFPLRDERGGVTSAVEVIRDVTEYKLLGESLERERRKMEAVIRGMAEALYIAGPDYVLRFLHRGQLPLPAEAVPASPAGRCHEALFGRMAPCPWCRMPEVLRSGQVSRRVGRLPGEGGEERFFQVTLAPWAGAAGESASVIGLLVDISSQRRVERQLIRSEKLNSLAILSAGMAHELNNPLGAINFNLEILGRHGRDPEQREVVESIKRDVVRINRIVGNLQSFARSGTSAQVSWVRPAEVIDAALELFRVVMERRGVSVRRELDPRLPPIWGNAQDLQQVFVNLISNAVDAMPSGGTITVQGELDDADAAGGPSRVAVVYDHGGGLSVLRTLLDLPGIEAQFFRGTDEFLESFRRSRTAPPEILVLDLAEAGRDTLDFFLPMVREFAPEARLLVAAGADGPPARGAPGAAAYLACPFTAAELRAAMGSLLAGRGVPRPAERGVRITFSDTGCGMAADLRERVFDPFFTTKDNQGTGLGLSVVHKILANHEAAVRVESQPGQGATFIMTFPPAPSGEGEGEPGTGRGPRRGLQ